MPDCKQCGQPLPAGALTCSHCGVPVAAEMNCGSCGQPLLAGALTCSHCGVPVAAEMNCGSCGQPLPVGASACLYCGTPVWTAPQTAVQIQPTPIEEHKSGAGKHNSRALAAVGGVILLCALGVGALLHWGGPQAPSEPAAIDTQGQAVAPAPANSQVLLQVMQADTTQYPQVKLYLQLRDDLSGELLNALPNARLRITEQGAAQTEVALKPVSEQSSISFVLDISGSMEGERYQNAKQAISQLLDCMEQDGQMQASLIAFNDRQNLLEDFTRHFDGIRSELDSTVPDGETAFWDTLELALYRSAGQAGQKCIIAVTDGADNASQTTRENVIALSQQLQIPIYIATFDYDLADDLRELAEDTGGRCRVVTPQLDLSWFYLGFLEQQQWQFVATFTSDGETRSESARAVDLALVVDERYGAGTAEYRITGDLYADVITNSIITGVSASSALREFYESTGQLDHVPENAIDGSYRSAWVEDASGPGVGEWIELNFDKIYRISGLEISNGYKKSRDLFDKNSRVKRVRLHFSDGSSQEFDVADQFAGAQRLNFATPALTNRIRLEILDVYAGTKYQDTCITELGVY